MEVKRRVQCTDAEAKDQESMGFIVRWAFERVEIKFVERSKYGRKFFPESPY